MDYIGEIAWTIMAPMMLFLSVYSVYSIMKDKKKPKENRKINTVHKRAILIGNIAGWCMALLMINQQFHIFNTKSLNYLGPSLGILIVLGLLVTIRIMSPKRKENSPENMAFWGTVLCLFLLFVIFIWVAFGK
ncbi:hypothetical protein [Eubacterium limosum]|uniref:hypothetical protein n=1 Tax=Eubacterium limosum TaxID=1736 RepID=UPI003719E5A9